MSDTFDHEQEAFERWENGECDIPDTPIPKTTTIKKVQRPITRKISGYVEEDQVRCQKCGNWQRMGGIYCMNCGAFI